MILNALACTAERVSGWREEEKGHKKPPISAWQDDAAANETSKRPRSQEMTSWALTPKPAESPTKKRPFFTPRHTGSRPNQGNHHDNFPKPQKVQKETYATLA